MAEPDFDIAAWLRDLGLERYAQAFLDAELTPEALPELTEARPAGAWATARAT